MTNKCKITPPHCHDDCIFALVNLRTIHQHQCNFPTIIGKHSDDDMQRLLLRNFSALQDIDLGDGTDATGLILYKDDHKAENEN